MNFVEFLRTTFGKPDPVAVWKQQSQLWQAQYEREVAKYEWPEHITVEYLSSEFVTEDRMAWAKRKIELSGLTFLLERVNKIRVVKDPIPSIKGEGGTIQAPDMIVLSDIQFMPWEDLPGAIIHEAWHLHQIEIGTLKSGQATNRGQEAQAYAMQELFLRRIGQGSTLYARNRIAKTSIEAGVGFGF